MSTCSARATARRAAWPVEDPEILRLPRRQDGSGDVDRDQVHTGLPFIEQLLDAFLKD